MRDVSAEALEALISIGTVRGQGKGTAAAAAAANESWWSAGRPCGGWGSGGGGGSSRPGGGGLSSPSGVVVEGTGSGEVGRGGGAFARRKLTPEVLAHARHLAAEVQRVRRGGRFGEGGGEGGETNGMRWLARTFVHGGVT